MKNLSRYFRLFAVMLPAIGLTACGGYTAVNLGGSVSGLTSSGLVLANGDDTVTIPANATLYTFPHQIDYHGPYAVTIKTQPPLLTCTLASATGNASGIDINYVNVTCVKNYHTVGGVINGLTAPNLILTNGSDTVKPAATDTAFTFGASVAEGDVYGVAVLHEPDGQTCAVLNGTDVMGTANVTGVTVNCH